MPSSFHIEIDREEPFTIQYENWNKAVDRMWQNRPLKTGYSKDVQRMIHPWYVAMEWDTETAAWVMMIVPGFVRGASVEVDVPEWLAASRTLNRLGIENPKKPKPRWERGDEVVAFLDEWPRIPIAKDQFVQVYGPDGFNYAGYTIPKYFYDEGVPVPKELQINEAGGNFDFKIVETEPVDEDNKRMLFAVDVTLAVPRPIVEAVPVPGALGNSSNRIEVQVQYANIRETNPKIFASPTTTALPEAGEYEISALDALTGLTPQPATDDLHIARIWMMGPRGVQSEEVGKDWTPVVQHFVFWNVDHTVEIDVTNIDPFYIRNPVDFLFSGAFVAQDIVDGLNNANDEAVSRLNGAKIRGSYWTL